MLPADKKLTLADIICTLGKPGKLEILMKNL